MLDVNVYLQTQSIEYREQGGELRITLASFNRYNGINSYTCQISQCLLVDTQFFPSFLDGIPYFLLYHNLNVLRFRCKGKQFFSNNDTNSQQNAILDIIYYE